MGRQDWDHVSHMRASRMEALTFCVFRSPVHRFNPLFVAELKRCAEQTDADALHLLSTLQVISLVTLPNVLWWMAGVLCDKGLGVKQDVNQAVHLLTQSAELGHCRSRSALGMTFESRMDAV
jgi:hypothetical protein